MILFQCLPILTIKFRQKFSTQLIIFSLNQNTNFAQIVLEFYQEEQLIDLFR